MPTIIYTKNEVIQLLVENSQNQKNAKYSNDILLKMVRAISFETVECETTRNNDKMLNRGSLCEALIKIALFGYADGYKTTKNADIDRARGQTRAEFRSLELNPNRKYEVKFNTSFALAHDCPIKTKQVLMIIKEGAYLVESEEYNRATYPQGQRLDEFSRLIGLGA